MGMSAGAGSPIWFICWKGRQNWRTKAQHIRMFDITLTGRTRRYKPPYGSALGVRSTLTLREYHCECGHTGWSNHVDLERQHIHDEKKMMESELAKGAAAYADEDLMIAEQTFRISDAD